MRIHTGLAFILAISVTATAHAKEPAYVTALKRAADTCDAEAISRLLAGIPRGSRIDTVDLLARVNATLKLAETEYDQDDVGNFEILDAIDACKKALRVLHAFELGRSTPLPRSALKSFRLEAPDRRPASPDQVVTSPVGPGTGAQTRLQFYFFKGKRLVSTSLYERTVPSPETCGGCDYSEWKSLQNNAQDGTSIRTVQFQIEPDGSGKIRLNGVPAKVIALE